MKVFFQKNMKCLHDVTGTRVQLHILLVQIFNVILVENYLNRSWSTFNSCVNLLAEHNLTNPCLWKIWLYLKKHLIMELYNTKVLSFIDKCRFEWMIRHLHHAYIYIYILYILYIFYIYYIYFIYIIYILYNIYIIYFIYYVS